MFENAKGIKVINIESLASKNMLAIFISIYKVIRSEQPDLVHTHSAIASFVGRFAARLAGVKTLYTVHGWHFVPNTVWKRRYFGRILEFMARPFTSAWITVSDFDYKFGIEKGVAKDSRTWSIANGVEEIQMHPSNSADQNLRIVFIGRASFQKNCLEVIDIFELVDERATLTMYVTSGDHLGELKQRIESSVVAQRVSLEVDNPNASTYLKGFDAMLITSRYEGMPLCALEAMSAGLAVVSTDVCSMNEVVDSGKTGFLYELGNIHSAANYIELLQDDDMRQKFAIAARERYELFFSAELMTNKTVDIYDYLLAD